MALKPDRNYTSDVDISFFMNETAERGIIVIHDTAATGTVAAMDDANATVSIPTGTNGQPAGLLLNDVVNLDLTRQHINWHQDEVQIGGKVTLLKRGVVVTDQLVTGIDPLPGEKAYFTTSGKISNSSVATDDINSATQIGRFLSSKNSDGFAKVEINIV